MFESTATSLGKGGTHEGSHILCKFYCVIFWEMKISPSSSLSDSSFIFSESATFWDKNKGTDAVDQNNENSVKNEEPGLDGYFSTLIAFSH